MKGGLASFLRSFRVTDSLETTDEQTTTSGCTVLSVARLLFVFFVLLLLLLLPCQYAHVTARKCTRLVLLLSTSSHGGIPSSRKVSVKEK